MPNLLTAATGETQSGFGRLDFIRMRVGEDGELGVLLPWWWTATDTRFAMLSRDDSDALSGCTGDCSVCGIEWQCEQMHCCRVCMWWDSKNGMKGTCADPAYGGERKRRTVSGHKCEQFHSRWFSFDMMNSFARRVPIEKARVYAAAAEAGVEEFSQADLDEFMETVKRLHSFGIIMLPKAKKGVSNGR